MNDEPKPNGLEPTAGRPSRLRFRTGRRIATAILGVAILGGGGFVFHNQRSVRTAQTAPRVPDPIPVSAARAKVQDLPIDRSGLGTVTPENQVDMKVRIDGQLERLAFAEGQEVKAGDLLAEIDPRPYQAVLAQAEAALQKDVAQLHNAEADEARAVKLTSSSAGTS